MKAKITVGETAFDIVNYVFFGVFTLSCIFPFYYMLINTISRNDLVSRGLIMLLPRGIHFNNYINLLRSRDLPGAVFMSVARTVLGTGLTVLCTSFVAYGITKRELWHRKAVYRFFIFTMYFNAGLIPWYLNMRMLHLTNNFLAYIIGVVSAFNLILVKTYIESIPASLEESAEIDGAGYLLIYFRLILPLAKPILATIAIFTAVGQWNSFMDTLILMQDKRLYTLQYILWQYLQEASRVVDMVRALSSTGITVDPSQILTITSVKMTVALVVTLPVLLVYPFFQKYFVRGIMIGAVKG
ncbi:MAG: carbohydrate ABC transporter permease [Treponema sp.]|jgi:putative aldouronate transport system permease protein|nr:carbohydrate ABC transporter permease [Treponema sp.]